MRAGKYFRSVILHKNQIAEMSAQQIREYFNFLDCQETQRDATVFRRRRADRFRFSVRDSIRDAISQSVGEVIAADVARQVDPVEIFFRR